MKKLTALLALGFLLSPALALAQDAQPAGPPDRPQLSDAQRQALESQMQQFHAQMEQLHTQARTQILAALTPAHRTFVANVIGQLATSPNPDRAAAARQIDAALSRGEGQSVVRIAQGFATQVRALHESMRKAFESQLTPEQKAQMDAHHAQMAGKMEQHMARKLSDPGEILLHMSGEGPEMRMMGPMFIPH